MQNRIDPKVIIRCWTFNHEPYIRQCLDGFVMQQTEFPFAAIIIDDASTDGEQEILWDFINKELNPISIQKEETDDYTNIVATHKINQNCIFVLFLLKYNHYKIKKNKKAYLKKWEDKTRYIATCEGDDYWTDPNKLQKQVDFLETHPDFTMVCNRTRLYSKKKKKFIGENYCYNKSQVVNPKHVIYRTGLFISTCSYVYRKTILDNIPDYWAKCKVKDYPLQIMCTMKGKIYYFNDLMTVYRIENPNSWMGSQQWGKFDMKRIEVIKSQVNMFKGFGQDFPQYKKYFKRKIANQINRFIPASRPKQETDQYLECFSKEIEEYDLLQRFDLWMCKLRIPRVRYLYKQFFHHIFSERRMFYNRKSLPVRLYDRLKNAK